MRVSLRWLLFGFGLLCTVSCVLGREPVSREWRIDGVVRTALLWLPTEKNAKSSPVVFLFHGHGGTAAQIARSMPIAELWPEALVVCMQGLPTPGQLTDPQGEKPGWQAAPGDQGDRDLKFFDSVWEALGRDYAIDRRRVYASGHSNGGGFTYLLWATRREVFAAFAPSSAVANRRIIGQLTPAPVLHLAGRADALVKFEWQSRMIEFLKRLNGCTGESTKVGPDVTRYGSAHGHAVLTYIHDGGHRLPSGAAAVIVAFLRGPVPPTPP